MGWRYLEDYKHRWWKSIFIQLRNQIQVLFDVVDDAQTDGLNEPILLATADGNMQTQATAEFTGRTEETQMTIRFSDLVGSSAYRPIRVCDYQR